MLILTNLVSEGPSIIFVQIGVFALLGKLGVIKPNHAVWAALQGGPTCLITGML